MLYEKYNQNLHVITFLSDETIEYIKNGNENGYSNLDWKKCHEMLISNLSIQKITILHGSHYIHHLNSNEICNGITVIIAHFC